MVKCVFLLRRKSGMSREAFLDYWVNSHSQLALKTLATLGICRYVQSYPASHPVAEAMAQARGCQRGDFDGMAEAWWDNFEAMSEAAGNVPQEVASAVLADETRFIDMEQSVIWFAEEHVLLSDTPKLAART